MFCVTWVLERVLSPPQFQKIEIMMTRHIEKTILFIFFIPRLLSVIISQLFGGVKYFVPSWLRTLNRPVP
jgi:hypothetical protein